MERNNLRLVYYYDLPKRTRHGGELTMNLIESLSKTLCAYPVVTGRLMRAPDGRWRVKFNDAGLRLVEARVDGSVYEWLKNVDRENELKLVYWEEMYHKPYFWSTFYVQITEFEGGGLAIGLSCTHLLSDPICAMTMIKAWADTTLGREITSPALFDPVPVPNQEDGKKRKLDSHLINHYKLATGHPSLTSHTKQTTITLQFDQEMVQACIDMATNTTSHEPTTPFEALAALFWTRISKIKGREDSLVDMLICMDVRKVLNLDTDVFGNFTVYSTVKGDKPHDDQVCRAAAAFVREAVTKMYDYDEIVGLIEWLERANYESPPWMNGSCLICVNLEDVESYSAVFEDNVGPIRASYYIEPAIGPGQIVVLPSPWGGDGPYGRVVSVTLPEDEAKKLLEDALVKQFHPSVLMGLNKKL